MSKEPPNNGISSETIDPREIPPSLLSDIVLEHRYFAILLFRIHAEKRPEYIGSGTFVTIDGEYFILTAEHVWAELKRGDSIGLSHTSGQHLDRVRIDIFNVFVPEPRQSEEWGPDLALLRIPDNMLHVLKNDNAFHDLNKVLKRIDTEPLNPDREFWFFLGAPDELTVLDTNGALLKVMGYFSSGPELLGINMRAPYDYYDLRVNRQEIRSLPRSHSGMSGGGLWRVEVYRNTDGSFQWSKVRRFEGVVFFEFNPPDEVGYVRAHGRESLLHLVTTLRAHKL